MVKTGDTIFEMFEGSSLYDILQSGEKSSISEGEFTLKPDKSYLFVAKSTAETPADFLKI